MKKLRHKHVKLLKEKVKNLDDFMPLNKESLIGLFHHIDQSSTINLTNDIGTKEPFDPSFRREVEDLIQEIDPDDFDYDDANTKLG